MKTGNYKIILFTVYQGLSGILFSQQNKISVRNVYENLSSHYENRSVIKEVQIGTIHTETENYEETAVAAKNSLLSANGISGYVTYLHAGPFKHNLNATGGKFIYGWNYSNTSSLTFLFEGMAGKNAERNSSGEVIAKSNVIGFGSSVNIESKWIGGSLGFSAGRFMPRNDQNIVYFSSVRASEFDVFGRYRIRVLPHRWVFFEYSTNNLFLFQGGQGKFNQATIGSGLGLTNGTELKAGTISFLKTSGFFLESTVYLKNKYGLGVNYTIYNQGSRYASFKFCYRFGNKKF